MSAAGDPPNVQIRPARPSDREAVVDLHLAVHTELYAPPSLDVAKHIAEARPRMLRGSWRSGSYQVAEAGGRIVGYVQVVYDFVNALYVYREVRGRGVGSALLAAAERQLRAKGAARVRVRVASDREEVVRFYAKHGWLAGRDLGTDKTWEVKLLEMHKQLYEQNPFMRIAPWLAFKLALAAGAFSILALFGEGLHDLAHLPGGVTAAAFLFSALMIGIVILLMRRPNLRTPRCCLYGLTTVGCYLLTFMIGTGIGSLTLNVIGIDRLARAGAGYVAAVVLLPMIVFMSVYARRLANSLYLRLV